MTTASSKAVSDAIGALPAELQESVTHWFDRLESRHGSPAIPPARVAPLTRLVAVSEFGASVAAKEWPWLEAQDFSEPTTGTELDGFVADIVASREPIETVQQRLRAFRNRYLLRVLWREVTGDASLEESLEALSNLADRLLDAACQVAQQQMLDRYGVVRDASGEILSLVVVGMGKLGGGELNFSSDIDLVFLYPDGGDSDGERALSAPEYFARVSRHVVALLDEITSDGFVFRIDTRLRPFGDSGPPVVSFAALESYLTQHGRGWERYAYIKARVVGTRPPEPVLQQLYDELIVPFVYRRYLDFGVFESLREMQALIAAEVRRRDLADNVKLGPGGIREIEFIVQSLQLVRGGSRSDLQERRLQTVLPRLVGHHGMGEADAAELTAAYRFLRRTENFIQGIRDQQTHDLPTDATDRARLRLAMGYPDWDAFVAELDRHRQDVTRQFERIAFRGEDERTDDGLKREIGALWDRSAGAGEWSRLLAAERFAAADELGAAVAKFAASAQLQRIDATSTERLRRVMPELLALLRETETPQLTWQRLLGVIERVLRRSAYLALLIENATAMSRLVSLCAQSGYIAEQIARYPLLLDELLDPRIYTARITRAELERELQQRLASCPLGESELQMERLAQFQRASQFRIAVADYNGSLPIMRVSDSLTDLAECVLSHALKVAWADMTGKHGTPRFTLDGERRKAGFGIIGYGKLGGIELSYTSDLDIVFLHDSRGENQVTDGDRPLDNSMFFMRLVRRLVHFLTTQTASGLLYEVDMRLRPDGRSGLLVSSVDAFERYQEENAWTWEHQALLRARPVAGSAVIAREFERVRVDTLTGRVARDSLRDDVVSMRQRMRKELDKSDGEHFDLKQGRGGIGDIEFIVQYLVLAHARDKPAVIHYPDNIRQLATLAAAGCLPEDRALRLQDVYRAYRLRLHRLALDENASVVNAGEFVDERDSVVETWASVFGA